MKKSDTRSAILRGLYHYVLFFLLVAFLVSSTMSLFVSTLSDDLGITLTGENLSRAAKLTFLNVLLLSVLLTAFDILRRKLTTERITGRIAAATKEIVKGNFDVRIPQSTARLVLDEKYSEIIDCFNKMAGELGSLETLRTDFIANVSHEMKTPLAVMQNYGTLLQAPDLPEEKRLEYAKGVTDGVKRLADMMTNILKLNRLENQQIFPQVERFDLGSSSVRASCNTRACGKRVVLRSTRTLPKDVTVQGDRELLALVWNNLLSNAFKFTPSGGTVSVSLTADEAFATVRVQDTGCGMSAEVGRHIFEKFYQGDMSHATQGNGLGLALVDAWSTFSRGKFP